jgi:glycosyltransferase involved in cell wall biosynthesis
MERFCLQAATTVISPSRYLIDAIKKEFPFTNTRAFIVPYPFEVHARSGAPEPTANSEKIIFYGKLSAQKGTFKLLDYFEKLWDEDFNESLYVYGGDDIVYHPEGKAMGAIVRERYGRWIQAGKLHLNPKIAPSEMETHLGGAKLIIVPSTVDNLPFVVLEMMALGNIVLASKQGGQSEIITDGEDGFLFDHEQSQTFKAKLFQIIMLTPEERKTIRQKARQRIATAYNPDLIYAQKIGVLEKAAMQKQSGQFPFTRQLQAPATSEEELLFQKGLLSVVVPYYNLGRYIGETIASLQQCLYREMEIIIVNDGSTDNASLQALEAYRNNKGITIIDTPNGGLANARNTGAWAARGEYLAFLDADDMVTPDYYIKAIAVLKRWSNVYFVGCWTQYFAGSSNVWPTFTPEPPIILYHNTINSSALVYKRTSFLHKGLNDAHMTFPGLEDYESVIALLNAGYRGVILPELLFKYRVRTNSMIRSISKNKKLYLVQYITEKHKRFYATFAAEIASLLQANGPGIYLDNPTLDYTVYSKHRLLNKIAAKTIGFVKRSPRLKKMALTVYRKLKS